MAEVNKAEYPINKLGLGYRSTLEHGPFLFTEVAYKAPEENFDYTYCGACTFSNNGYCMALSRDVHMLGTCKLYISTELELGQRHAAYSAAKTATNSEPEPATMASDEIRKDILVKIAATDEEKCIVVGIVLEPDEVDSYDHTVTKEEIEDAAYRYALTPMVVGNGHIEQAKARPVETYIYDPEVLKNVKPGSWVMSVKVDDPELWNKIKSGELTGFSIGAKARLVPVDEEE